MSAYVLLYFSGLLTLASPCIFPVIPLVVAHAARGGRHGPWFLVLGFSAAFSTTLAVLAALESQIFVDANLPRYFGASVMIVASLFMLSSKLSDWLASHFVFLQRKLPKTEGSSKQTNFFQGLLLGLVWAPCIGPTLAASLTLLGLAGQRITGLAHLAVFTLGAATPLLALSFGSRGVFETWLRNNKSLVRKTYRAVAFLMIILGASVLLGWDKSFEAWITPRLPEWWTEGLTRY